MFVLTRLFRHSLRHIRVGTARRRPALLWATSRAAAHSAVHIHRTLWLAAHKAQWGRQGLWLWRTFWFIRRAKRWNQQQGGSGSTTGSLWKVLHRLLYFDGCMSNWSWKYIIYTVYSQYWHETILQPCHIQTPCLFNLSLSLLSDCNHISPCPLLSPLLSSRTLFCVASYITSSRPHHNLILRRHPCLIQSRPCEIHKMQHLRLHSRLPPVLISTPLEIHHHSIPPDLRLYNSTKNKQCRPLIIYYLNIVLYKSCTCDISNTSVFLFCVLQGCTLFLYESDGRSGIDHNSVPKHALWVENSIVQAVPEHPKKDFVFCLSNSVGDAFLFQVRDTTVWNKENWRVHSF